MCQYCEGIEGDVHRDPDLATHSYLTQYDANWTLTISDGAWVLETTVENCPWCGRDLSE